MPFFSLIIVLTGENAYLLPFTLDSIAREQEKVSFEVIIVDGTKGTVLSNLPVKNVRILKAEKRQIPAMLNQALRAAQGEYLHFLFPGEFYATNEALVFMKKKIEEHAFPDLIHTPRRERHQFGQPTVDLTMLTLESLKKGDVPWSLQAYFFRAEALLMLGGFSEAYQTEWGYDLLCRLFLAPSLRKAFVKRVLTDYEYRRAKPDWIWRRSVEMARISFKYFGPTRHLFSWLMQNCLRLFRYLWKIVRGSFWKTYVTN